MSDVTRILSQIEQGDPQAAEQLLPLVYDELRKLAAAKLAQEKPGQTLQATALVHEAYLRLVGSGARTGASRTGTAAATSSPPPPRRCGGFWSKRPPQEGGETRERAGRHDLHEIEIAAAEIPEDLVALDEALSELAAIDKPAADLVHLRYFAGLSIPDAADAMKISPRTAARLWAYARAWLRQKVEGPSPSA